MSPHNSIVARDGAVTTSTPTDITPTMYNLLIALVILFATIAVLVSGLLVLRTRRNRSKKAHPETDTLPAYNEGSHRPRIRSTLSINAPAYVAHEKQNLMDNSTSPPGSPIPEIRITFPEEVDEGGKRKSGRVVVVRVGEHTVGMEPVNAEKLPPYQQSENDRFQSLDLERIGGLKEKVDNEKGSDKTWN